MRDLRERERKKFRRRATAALATRHASPCPSLVADEDTPAIPAVKRCWSPKNGVFKDSSHHSVFRSSDLLS
ncbi:hypothetical protein TorRG33x02_200200 [Trema orientale]|uniref:Uncharacterized protein n=1 Tax=Trema orientale TaxID=63057 RepID=A0A2P5EF27_TREOI|nr:hypothetical protein TorRG33x02_200200 [Trema orientale]